MTRKKCLKGNMFQAEDLEVSVWDFFSIEWNIENLMRGLNLSNDIWSFVFMSADEEGFSWSCDSSLNCSSRDLRSWWRDPNHFNSGSWIENLIVSHGMFSGSPSDVTNTMRGNNFTGDDISSIMKSSSHLLFFLSRKRNTKVSPFINYRLRRQNCEWVEDFVQTRLSITNKERGMTRE